VTYELRRRQKTGKSLKETSPVCIFQQAQYTSKINSRQSLPEKTKLSILESSLGFSGTTVYERMVSDVFCRCPLAFDAGRLCGRVAYRQQEDEVGHALCSVDDGRVRSFRGNDRVDQSQEEATHLS